MQNDVDYLNEFAYGSHRLVPDTTRPVRERPPDVFEVVVHQHVPGAETHPVAQVAHAQGPEALVEVLVAVDEHGRHDHPTHLLQTRQFLR